MTACDEEAAGGGGFVVLPPDDDPERNTPLRVYALRTMDFIDCRIEQGTAMEVVENWGAVHWSDLESAQRHWLAADA